MDSVLASAQKKQNELIAFLRKLVECESPSEDPAAIGRFVDLLASELSGSVTTQLHASTQYGPTVQFAFAPSQPGHDEQILVLGHSDTVYPFGTLSSMPFMEKDGRLWGPGVLDM